jgi:hypothetical protein
MRALVVLALCAAGHILPETAAAQRLEGVRYAARSPSSADTTARPQLRASRTRVFWVRSLSATVGSVAGAFGGYGLGHMYTPRPRDYYVLSDEEAVGILGGFLVGAALGAALHSYDSNCSLGNRVVRGLGGAVLGFIPAMIVGPFGPGMGAAALQGRC